MNNKKIIANKLGDEAIYWSQELRIKNNEELKTNHKSHGSPLSGGRSDTSACYDDRFEYTIMRQILNIKHQTSNILQQAYKKHT